MSIETIISIFSAIGVIVLGVLEWNTRKRQAQSQSEVNKADATERIIRSASTLINDLQEELISLRPLVGRVSQLEHHVDQQQKSINRLLNWTERLVKQIKDAGMEPVAYRVDDESERITAIRTERVPREK